MADKHWTEKLAEKVFDSGYKYAIMRNGVKKAVGFNNLVEFIHKIKELGGLYDDNRLAIKPVTNDMFDIVYYYEDGSYWVVGFIFERPNDYKMPDLSQAGIIKI